MHLYVSIKIHCELQKVLRNDKVILEEFIRMNFHFLSNKTIFLSRFFPACVGGKVNFWNLQKLRNFRSSNLQQNRQLGF